ncbi:MAG: hypothetical protein AABX88_01375 [Nanoarchaeota archaeon]|mgnify:CR=1 FL=1
MEKSYGNCLAIGVDDSNHAGQNSLGEINTALFSWLHQDSIVKDFSNTRDKRAAIHFMDHPQRDYRFGLLTSERYRRSSKNLIETVPYLVSDYLSQLEEPPEKLQIFLDGALQKYGRSWIREQIKKEFGIKNIVVDNFTKKHRSPTGDIMKFPRCPEILYFADIWANLLYNSAKTDDISKHEKLVFIK